MSWGGKRDGSGRKSKADEFKLLDKLYANYFYGKPRETQDITLNQDTPLFEVVVKDNENS